MTADWRKLSRDAKLVIRGAAVEVDLGDRRKQLVYADDSPGGAMRVWSVVAKTAVIRELAQPNIRAWTRNRVTELVGFKVDESGRMIGEAWVPLAGLKPTEWEFYVRAVALACDRFEYVLTGKDVE